jgi:hypothetical protein
MLVGGVVKFLPSRSSSSCVKYYIFTFTVVKYWVVFGDFDEGRWRGFVGGHGWLFVVRDSGLCVFSFEMTS